MLKLLMIIGIVIGFLPAGFAHAQFTDSGGKKGIISTTDGDDSVLFDETGIFTLGDGETIDFGMGDDILTLSAMDVDLVIDGGRIDFGADNDKIILRNLSFLTLKNGGIINFGAGNDELTISTVSAIYGIEGGGTINFGEGEDKIINEGNFQLGDGNLVVDLGSDDDVFINRNNVDNISIKFGEGNDTLTNSGRITIQNTPGDMNRVLEFGAGDDVFTNEAGGHVSLGNTLSFGEGDDRFESIGELTLILSSSIFSDGGMDWKGLELFLLRGEITFDFTGEIPETISSFYRIITLDKGAEFINMNTGITIEDDAVAAFTSLGIANPEIFTLFEKNDKGELDQVILVREGVRVLPDRSYDIASKPDIDCLETQCKGSTSFIPGSIDSSTFTLDSRGFAVEEGKFYFSSANPLLNVARSGITSKVQIDGFLYVDAISLDGDGNLVFGDNGNARFAALTKEGNFEVINYGYIYASGLGAIFASTISSLKVYNEGQFRTDKSGISVNAPDHVFELTNKGGIHSGGEAIYINRGTVTIDNEGSIYSTILNSSNRLPYCDFNTAICIKDTKSGSGPVIIINRSGGEIRYTVGRTYSGTPPDGAAISIGNRSDVEIYNEGFIVGARASVTPSKLYGIIWEESRGFISNSGGIYGGDGAIKIGDNEDDPTESIIEVRNIGTIEARFQNSRAIDIGEDTEFTLINYDGAEITGDSYAIYANSKYHSIHIINYGFITALNGESIALSLQQNRGEAFTADKTIIHNYGKVRAATGIEITGGALIFNSAIDASISGFDGSGIRISYGIGRVENGEGQRDVASIFNSGSIFGERNGIYYEADTNTSLLINNEGNITSRNIAIHVDTRNKIGDFNVSKIDILNKVTGGIYGRDKGIRITSIGVGASQIADEKVFIQNEGGILGRGIGISIDTPVNFLDITNEASGVIASEGIAIDIPTSGGNADRGNYLISNYGRILSDKTAYRDLGQGQLLNQGFILGDIIIVGAGSVVNEGNADNDFKKDLLGRIGGQLYSYKTSIDVASGVIVGNIYFYDNRNDDKGAAIANKFINSGTIYGNIDMAKGDDIYEHRGNGRVEGIIDPGEGADIIKITSGEMVLNILNKASVEGHRFLFDSKDKIQVLENARLTINISVPDKVTMINSITAASGSEVYIGNISLGNLVGASGPILDMGDTDITINGVLGVQFRFEARSLFHLSEDYDLQDLVGREIPRITRKVELLTTTGNFTIPNVIRKPIIMDISFEVDSTNKKIYMTYNGVDFTNVGELPNASEDVRKFAEYLQRLLEAEEMVSLPAGYSLLSSLITIDTLSDYIAKLEEALGVANYDSLLSDLSEISGVSGFVDDFTSANCAVRDRSHQSLVVSFEESGCSWTSFTEQSLGDRDEQAITSGRQAPLGEHWVSMVAAQYKKVELVDRVEGHARDSETYLLGAGLRSRAPIANVADLSVSLTMGRGEHRRNREWASVQQASMPEMNFQMVRIGASRSFALPLKGSWKITPSTDYNLVRVDVSDLQHEAVSGESVFAIDDMEHNRQSVRVGLELRGEHESERGSSLTAFARVGVEHYITGRSAGYTIRLVGASEGFSYYGRPIDENVLTTSFGITKVRGKAVSFRVFYEGKQGIGGIYENHEAKLELLKRF